MKWHSRVLIPFLTLSCNFKCTYCITKFAPDYDFNFKRIDHLDWIKFLNSPPEVTDIIFNGGEPTLYPNFHKIVNSLRHLSLIAIGTNYSNVATASLQLIDPRDDLILDGSFHPHFISEMVILQNLLILKSAAFKVRVHVVNYPGFKFSTKYFLHDFKIQGIDAFVQQYEGYWDGTLLPKPSKLPACSLQDKKSVQCSRSIYTPIAPNGDIYFCHYLMYSQTPEGILGHISDTKVDFPDYFPCSHYGWCSPCDWPRVVHFV